MEECIYCENEVSEDYDNVCEKHGAFMYLISARETFKDKDGEFARMECDCDCQHTKKVNIVLSILEKDSDNDMAWKIVQRVSGSVFDAVIGVMTGNLNLEKTLASFEKKAENGQMKEHHYNNHAKTLMYVKQLRDRMWGDDTDSD